MTNADLFYVTGTVVFALAALALLDYVAAMGIEWWQEFRRWRRLR